jgi:hypothetical protein
MEKGTGSWKKLHTDELYHFFSSLNISRIMKSRRIRRAGHVVGKRQMRSGW